MLLTVVALSATTVGRIEEKTGWHSCSACTKSTGTASTYSLSQFLVSPSQDGSSSKFHLGTSEPLSDVVWYKRISDSSSATHFSYTVHYYYTHPSIPTGMEFSANERRGYKWYRWDWQCSYYYGVWRVWDNGHGTWINVPIACTRPTAYKWTTVNFEGHRYNGKVYFDSITINGTKHYVNKSVYPKTMSSSSNSVTVHFQLNGDKSATDFDVWGDQFSLNYW
jgi:hypothetical protein